MFESMAFLPWATNSAASPFTPVPQSKIRRSPLAVVNSTQEVLPPKWFVPGPGVAIDPRVPQKRTLMSLRLPCVWHRPIGNSISLFVRVPQTLPDRWCQNIVGIDRLQSGQQRTLSETGTRARRELLYALRGAKGEGHGRSDCFARCEDGRPVCHHRRADVRQRLECRRACARIRGVTRRDLYPRAHATATAGVVGIAPINRHSRGL